MDDKEWNITTKGCDFYLWLIIALCFATLAKTNCLDSMYNCIIIIIYIPYIARESLCCLIFMVHSSDFLAVKEAR